MNIETSNDVLHSALGLKRLNASWAKTEIALGLSATGIAVWLLGSNPDVVRACCGLGLFVLGGYLALAGHRSHLYQSNNLLTAYLAEEIRKQKA